MGQIVKTVKFLKLTFTTELGKKRSMQIPYPKDDLDQAEILSVMKDVAQIKFFEFPNGDCFKDPYSAEVIERVTTTEEFDLVDPAE